MTELPAIPYFTVFASGKEIKKSTHFYSRRKFPFGHDRWIAYYKTSNYTILWTGILTVTPSPADEDNLSESCRYTTPWTLGLLKNWPFEKRKPDSSFKHHFFRFPYEKPSGVASHSTKSRPKKQNLHLRNTRLLIKRRLERCCIKVCSSYIPYVKLQLVYIYIYILQIIISICVIHLLYQYMHGRLTLYTLTQYSLYACTTYVSIMFLVSLFLIYYIFTIWISLK